MEFRSTKNKLYKCLLRKCLKMLSLGFKKFKENAIQRQADIKVRVAIQKVSAANQIYEIYQQWRIDREAFLIWKTVFLKLRYQQIGLELLNQFFMGQVRYDFNLIRDHTSLPKVEEKQRLKPMNLYKRLIPPPSPRDVLRLPPRVVYSSFTQSASRSQSSSHRLRSKHINSDSKTSMPGPITTQPDESGPICIFKKPMTLLNCNSSSESVTSSRKNLRYSRCGGGEEDYGEE